MEKVLVTGARGYLGQTIFQALIKEGMEVQALQDRLGDIPSKSLDHSCVVHCAGALRHRSHDLVTSNVIGTARLLEGISDRNCRIIFISSRAVYSPGTQKLTEDSLKVPVVDDEYGQTKLEGENLIMEAGFPYVILRPTNIYGLGVKNMGPGFIPMAITNFINQKPVTLYLPDRQQDFLSAWDMARLVLKSIRKMDLSRIAINCAGDPSSLHGFVRTLANLFEAKSGMNTELRYIPGPPARNTIMDNSLLKKTFRGFQFTSREIVFSRMLEFALKEL